MISFIIIIENITILYNNDPTLTSLNLKENNFSAIEMLSYNYTLIKIYGVENVSHLLTEEERFHRNNLVHKKSGRK
jgi:hypothetical protein